MDILKMRKASSSALPAYVATGTHASNSLVSNYPASIAAGDFLLAKVVANDAGSPGLRYDTPSGWQRITHVEYGTSGVVLAIFCKVADGSESGTLTFTKTGTAAAQTAAISRITGATTYESVVYGETPNSSTTPISTTAITTSGSDRLLLNIYGTGVDATLTPEAGWSADFLYSFNGAGAQDYTVAMDSAAPSGIGTQTTEEPTVSGTSHWNFVSLALCPSGSFPSASISARASRITYVNNAQTINFQFPAGSKVGDLCVICLEHAFALTATPTGWTLLNNSTGTNTEGASFYKVLSSTDIATGTVTINWNSGNYYGVVAGISFVGPTGGIRTSAFSRNSTSSSPRTVTTGASPVSGDYAIYFGSTRENSTCTVNKGSSLQTSSNANASGCLYGGVLGSSGAVSADFSYSPVGTLGDYQGIIVVSPL